MAKKSLGYAELEWKCPNCGGRNAGLDKVCSNCGSAQPEDVEFVQPAEEKIVEDATVIARAKVGPDIHCAYCGTRNPGDAIECSQCGADLSEGAARDAGEVLGAHKHEPADDIACDFCGTLNSASARKCKNCGANLQLEEPASAAPAAEKRGGLSVPILIAIAVIIIVACIGIFVFLNRTDDVGAKVDNLSWERSIVIMGLAPALLDGWLDEIPQDADLGQCRQEHRYTSDEPQPNSTEVCGTPFTEDTGTGLGEVVQECQYEVYDDRCEYTVMRMQPIDTLILSGVNRNPQWPELNLLADQEEGEREESYRIVFSADGEQFVYTTRDAEEFQNFVPGTVWTLKVNQLGGVTDVEPAP